MREKQEGVGFKCEVVNHGSCLHLIRSRAERADEQDVVVLDLPLSEIIGKDQGRITLVLDRMGMLLRP